MTREEARKRLEVYLICAQCPEDKECYDSYLHSTCEYNDCREEVSLVEAIRTAIKALEQEPKTGQWIRMSDLSEQEDDRYKCSHCGNIIHHKNKMNLYTFNSWCGRCGSDNGR